MYQCLRLLNMFNVDAATLANAIKTKQKNEKWNCPTHKIETCIKLNSNCHKTMLNNFELFLDILINFERFGQISRALNCSKKWFYNNKKQHSTIIDYQYFNLARWLKMLAKETISEWNVCKKEREKFAGSGNKKRAKKKEKSIFTIILITFCEPRLSLSKFSSKFVLSRKQWLISRSQSGWPGWSILVLY